MTSTELAPTTGPTAPVRRRRAEPDVIAATGERISASAARKLRESVPRNSRDARSSRWHSYSQWCADYDWATDEPRTAP